MTGVYDVYGYENHADVMTQVETQNRAQCLEPLQSMWSQDLHRTILAHNHNSDLMRHHRDALDEAGSAGCARITHDLGCIVVLVLLRSVNLLCICVYIHLPCMSYCF